jgi:sarcosine oxidase subunit beta
VTVLSQHRVDAIEVAQQRVRALTAGAERVQADVVVNAAGSWAGAVGELAGVSIPVVPSPRLQIVSEPQHVLPPATPLIADLSSGAYVRAVGDRVLAGVSPKTSPVGFEMQPRLESEEIGRITTLVATRFPGLQDIGVSRTKKGLYEMTPDGLPIAGGVEAVSGFYTVAGFNGHGIMHSPPLACAIADVIVQGRTDRFDLRPFALERFADGQNLQRRQSSLI